MSTSEEMQTVPSEQPEQQAADATAATANGGGEGVLSQEQVNKLVGEVRTKARETAVTGLLGELGVDSVDTLKARLQAQRDAELAQLSEVERLQAQLTAAQATLSKVNGVEAALEVAEQAIIAQVEAQVKRLNVPKHITTLLAALSPVEQLQYLSANGEAFAKPVVPDVNGNARGAGKPKVDEALLRSRYGI